MTLTLPKPDDWHVHLRQGPQMALYARAHARSFGRVLAMPNTLPPLTTSQQILRYCQEAQEVAPGLTVIPSFRLMPTMGGQEIQTLASQGILAGKYYPDGATTNSKGGLNSWRQVDTALAVMEENGLVLCLHGEDPNAPMLSREENFLPIFQEIRRAFPRLKMVFEHLSTAAAVRLVQEDKGPTSATITVQHLLFTLDNLLGGLLNPHLFCKPILKLAKDRQALQEVVLDADPRFFFGSDSAPHPQKEKESGACPAGVYAAPSILPALATWFEEKNALDKLESYLCDFGRRFYQLPQNQGTLVLERVPWTVPLLSEGSVPLLAGENLPWRVVEP